MASDFKIESGIPLPTPGRDKYPWDDLEVGQSFLVPDVPKYFASIVSQAGRTRQKKFALRSVDGGIRVWRVA